MIEVVNCDRMEELRKQAEAERRGPGRFGPARPADRGFYDGFEVGFRAALAELKISSVEDVELDPGRFGTLECPFYGGYMLDYERACGAEMTKCGPGTETKVSCKWCPLYNGAVLVRAKAKAHKPDDYKIMVDFAADGPSETAWSVIARDSTGKVVAVATGLGSSDEAIEAAKAWIAKGGDA